MAGEHAYNYQVELEVIRNRLSDKGSENHTLFCSYWPGSDNFFVCKGSPIWWVPMVISPQVPEFYS